MRAITRNLVLVTGSRLFDGGVRFVTVPLVLGYFGSTRFGLIALAFSISGLLTIAEFGISVNAIRRLTELLQAGRLAELIDLVNSATFFYLIVGLFNLLVVGVIGWQGPRWFGLDEAQANDFFCMMLSLGLFSACTWALSIYRQVLHASGLVGWDEGINLGSSALTLAVVGATLHWHWGPALYFSVALLPQMVPMVLRVMRVQKLVPGLRFRPAPNWNLFRPLVGTSVWLFVLALAETLANQYRPIILAQQAGLSSVADFRIVQQVAGFATLLLAGVMTVVYPIVAKLDASEDAQRLHLAMTRGSRLLLWAHLAILVPMAFLAAPMLSLYVGRSFEPLAPALAVWLLSLLAYHNSIVSSLVLGRGRLAPLALSASIAAALSLLIGHALAPAYGVVAMAWTYSGYMAFQLASLYLVLLPRAGGGSGWDLAMQVFPRPLLAASMAAAVAWWLTVASHLPKWAAGVLFCPLFAAMALTVGQVLQDWREVRGGVRG
jgi:O-antigen/teichoic acid export membrane protein